MSTFQRMIVIPQEEYLSLSSMQNVKEPLTQHFYDLERRFNSEETVRDPYRRMVLQSNTLDQMKQVKDQLRNSLLVSTPKPYQTRAKALFQTVEDLLKYNEKGEIYASDGSLVSGSRMEDLIQHAVRDRRRRNMTPTGWTHFLNILRDHNVPRSILNRDTLDEMERRATAFSPHRAKDPFKRDLTDVMQIKTSPSSSVSPKARTTVSTLKTEETNVKRFEIFEEV